MNSRPILVTGAHRAGTTWIGRVLAASGEMAYISEPLNVLHRPGIYRVPVSHWYAYICSENEQQYMAGFQDLLHLRYNLGAEIAALRSARDILRMGRDYFSLTRGRLTRARPLIKDPFAVFSTSWFATRLGCQVVVIVRHPAAFVSSLKRLEWSFDLSNLTSQPLLVRDHLEPYMPEIRRLSRNSADLIGSAALLWRVIYAVVWQFRAAPGIRLVRHEDLALDPFQRFRDLYIDLGLNFTRQVEKFIKSASSSENPAEPSARSVHTVKLDSRRTIRNWTRRLSPEEIDRIRELTEDVACSYYHDSDWQP